MDSVNLNLLRYFCEVAKTKNITKASENMCISQPAITKAIMTLEDETNLKLFYRSKKGVTLTKEGEVLYSHIEKILTDLDKTFNTISSITDGEGHFYIGTTTSNFLEPIESALDYFRCKYPKVHVDIILEEVNVLNDRAKLNKLDIAIINNFEQLDNFEKICSFSVCDKFIASKKYFKHLEDKILSLDDILSLPLVLLSNITNSRKNFNAFLYKNNRSIIPTYEFNSYSLCKELIKNGFGIGIGNPIHYESKDFIVLNTDFSLPSRCFYIGYNNKSKNELISEFINFIQKKKK